MPKGKGMGGDGRHGADAGRCSRRAAVRAARAARSPKKQKEQNAQPKEPSGGKTTNTTDEQHAANSRRRTPAARSPTRTGRSEGPGHAFAAVEDEIVKEVWGHLPDKLRQQATQYYQQDFMPRYTDC